MRKQTASLARAIGGAGALFASILATDLLLGDREALAYCRTSSCANDEVGTVCVPASAVDCGKAIFWPSPCVSFSAQSDGGPNVTVAQAESVAAASFAPWEDADCGAGKHPRISIENLGPVTCGEIEYNQDGANNNAIIFRSNGWPYAATNALALTTVTFNVETGEIRDADIELNASDVTFSTSDTEVTFDLQSILTHEAGHFLGLAHSPDKDATMRADYPPKSTSLRDLSPDDVAGICALYPPGSVIDTCDPTPRGGLGDECNSPTVTQDTGCCAIAVGSGAVGSDASGLGTVASIAALVGLAAMLKRRR